MRVVDAGTVNSNTKITGKENDFPKEKFHHDNFTEYILTVDLQHSVKHFNTYFS